MSIARSLAFVALLGAGLAANCPAAAQSTAAPTAQPAEDHAELKDFFGRFTGKGLADERLLFYGVTDRELELTIGPTDKGFKVDWSTAMRPSGDPYNDKVKRKANELSFVSSGRENFWRLSEQGDPLQGEAFGWARIAGRSLIIYLMRVDEKGLLEINQYIRTLTSTGIEVAFSMSREGRDVRTVDAKLDRVSN
jgi:hypothetical protein